MQHLLYVRRDVVFCPLLPDGEELVEALQWLLWELLHPKQADALRAGASVHQGHTLNNAKDDVSEIISCCFIILVILNVYLWKADLWPLADSVLCSCPPGHFAAKHPESLSGWTWRHSAAASVQHPDTLYPHRARRKRHLQTWRDAVKVLSRYLNQYVLWVDVCLYRFR